MAGSGFRSYTSSLAAATGVSRENVRLGWGLDVLLGVGIYIPSSSASGEVGVEKIDLNSGKNGGP